MGKTQILFSSFRFDTTTTDMVDAWAPQFWAYEAAEELSNLPILQTVNRDYDNALQEYGDTVNITVPGTFVAIRKGDENVTVQETSARKVPVVLNQHLHVSFYVKDTDFSKAFVDLVETYLAPAMQGISDGVAQIIGSAAAQFMSHHVGSLNGNTDLLKTVIKARQMAQDLKMSTKGRNFSISTSTEANLLAIRTFNEAQKSGDSGETNREGVIQRRFGFEWVTSYFAPGADIDLVKYAVGELASAATRGTKSLTLSAAVAGAAVGNFLTFETEAGASVPYTIASVATTAVTLNEPLEADIATGVKVRIFSDAAINHVGGYESGTPGWLSLDGCDDAYAPKAGMVLKIGADVYVILNVKKTGASAYDVQFTEPLKSTVADDAQVNFAPSGWYNACWTPDAVTFVTRPLATVERSGVNSYVSEKDGVGVRVTISYDSLAQKQLVTVDLLCGIKVVKPNKGFVMFDA